MADIKILNFVDMPAKRGAGFDPMFANIGEYVVLFFTPLNKPGKR